MLLREVIGPRIVIRAKSPRGRDVADTADRDANHAQRARFDEVFGQYERLRAGLDDIQQKVADLRGTAESDEALVRATVGGRGQLVNLKLDRRVFLMDPAELARTIVD